MLRINAVLGKELTTRMRRGRAALILTLYLVVLAVVSLLLLINQGTPEDYATSARLGQGLFAVLTGFQMALIIFITPASIADAISGERQRQTLDLLLGTRLSSLSIVLGKLAAGLAFDVLLILASVPLFSLVFLFGGVSPADLASMFAVFLATTLVLGALALFISTITRRGSATIIVSMLCTLGLTAGLGLVTAYLGVVPGGSGADVPWIAYLDPLVGYLAALPDFTSNNITYFTGGPLHLTLWQDQVIVDVVLAVLFTAASVRLLRPRWPARWRATTAPSVGEDAR
jgi:ABC-type transport system involved in multi-copper enzyme maturation permease subunit